MIMILFIETVISRCSTTITVKARYNAGRGRKNFEAKNRVIARSALERGFPMGGFVTIKRPNCRTQIGDQNAK